VNIILEEEVGELVVIKNNDLSQDLRRAYLA
jgi:hypothetical protein